MSDHGHSHPSLRSTSSVPLDAVGLGAQRRSLPRPLECCSRRHTISYWVVAGVLQVSVVPFTLVVILTTNKQLLSPKLDRRSAQTERLLARWGKLHAVRTVLSALALVLFLYLAPEIRVTGKGAMCRRDV